MQRPPELIRLERLGTALSSLGRESPMWKALEEILVTNALTDARQMAHAPETSEDKRAFWVGACYALEDVWKELQDFQSGAWKQWPNVARMQQSEGEEE
jgi:hypothetical protein